MLMLARLGRLESYRFCIRRSCPLMIDSTCTHLFRLVNTR
jgi:hypothetical protein